MVAVYWSTVKMTVLAAVAARSTLDKAAATSFTCLESRGPHRLSSPHSGASSPEPLSMQNVRLDKPFTASFL